MGESLKFIDSSRGRKLLVIDDFIFQKNYTVRRNTYFNCSRKLQRCTARAIVTDFDEKTCSYSSFKVKSNLHNHDPDPESVQKKKTYIKKPKRKRRLKPAERIKTEAALEGKEPILVIMKCPESLKFIETTRGRKCVVIDDFIFQKSYASGAASYFYCLKKPKDRCTAALTVFDFDEATCKYSSFQVRCSLHNHEPDKESVERRECIESRRKRRKIINRKTGEVIQEEISYEEKETFEQNRRKSPILKQEQSPPSPSYNQVKGGTYSNNVKLEPEDLDQSLELDDLEDYGEMPSSPATTSPPPPQEDTGNDNSSQSQRCLMCSSSKCVQIQSGEVTLRLSSYLESDDARNKNAKCSYSLIFLRGVLSFPEADCKMVLEKLMEVNPIPGWWLTICSLCSETAEKIIKLHESMIRMERELEVLQNGVHEKMKAALESKEKNEIMDDDCDRVREIFRGRLRGRAMEQNQGKLRRILENRLGIDNHTSAEVQMNNQAPSKGIGAGNVDIQLPDSEHGDSSFAWGHDDCMDHESDENDFQETPKARRKSTRILEKKQHVKDERLRESSLSDGDDDSDPAYMPTSKATSKKKKPLPDRTKLVKSPQKAIKPVSKSKTDQIKSKYKATAKLVSENPPPPKPKPKKINPKCHLCVHRFKSYADRIQHKLDHETLTEFVCKLCNFPAVSEKGLSIHIGASHERGIDRRTECDKCGYIMLDLKSIKRHKEVHRVNDNILENPEGSFSCKLCSEVFRSRKSGFKHLGENHKEELGLRTFVCETCGKVTMSAGSLRWHIKFFHMKKKNYVCDYCGARFQAKLKLEDHKWKHKPPGQNKVTCDICGLEYSSPLGLKNHVKTFHEKKRHSNVSKSSGHSEKECPHCGVKVVHDKALSLHLKTKHVDIMRFECDLCDARFEKEGNLKNHRTGVHGTGQYQCPNCESVFKCDGYLKRHLRVHCKNNPGSKQALSKRKSLGSGSGAKDEEDTFPGGGGQLAHPVIFQRF